MPAAIAAVPAIGWITAASAGATVAGQAVSSRAQSRAQREATAASTRANDEATRYQREQDALDRADAARVDNERRMQWQAEQDRLAPYREQQEAAARRYSELTGVPMPAPSRPSQMPEDWGRTGSTPPGAGGPTSGTGRQPVYDHRQGYGTNTPPPRSLASATTGGGLAPYGATLRYDPRSEAGMYAQVPPSMAAGVMAPPSSEITYRRPPRPQRSY